jgi:hypothetical protein
MHVFFFFHNTYNIATWLVAVYTITQQYSMHCKKKNKHFKSGERCPTNAQGRWKQFFIVRNKLPRYVLAETQTKKLE